MEGYCVATSCIELCCLLGGERSSEPLVLLSTSTCRFMCLATSLCLGKRCCGQSGIQDGAGMRLLCGVGGLVFSLDRFLSVSVRGNWSQGRSME